jgi:hypothetical protein
MPFLSTYFNKSFNHRRIFIFRNLLREGQKIGLFVACFGSFVFAAGAIVSDIAATLFRLYEKKMTPLLIRLSTFMSC